MYVELGQNNITCILGVERTFKVLVQHMNGAGGSIRSKETAPESKVCTLAVVHGQNASPCKMRALVLNETLKENRVLKMKCV
jgi:hypothetical protein